MSENVVISGGQAIVNAGQAVESTQMVAAEKVRIAQQQIAIIHSLLRATMKVDVHYGKIPGTKKLSLYKPGADILGLTFGLRPEYDLVEKMEIGDGAVEYEYQCRLIDRKTGMEASRGIGSANSRETKWAYRQGPKDSTGVELPKAYWKLRDTDPDGAKLLMAKAVYGEDAGLDQARGLRPSKNPDNGDAWEIFEVGGRSLNENFFDVRNTVKKIAKKRSYLDAMITATASSDIFDQDVVDEETGEVRDEALGHDFPETGKARKAPNGDQGAQGGRKPYTRRAEPAQAQPAGNGGGRAQVNGDDVDPSDFMGRDDDPRLAKWRADLYVALKGDRKALEKLTARVGPGGRIVEGYTDFAAVDEKTLGAAFDKLKNGAPK